MKSANLPSNTGFTGCSPGFDWQASPLKQQLTVSKFSICASPRLDRCCSWAGKLSRSFREITHFQPKCCIAAKVSQINHGPVFFRIRAGQDDRYWENKAPESFRYIPHFMRFFWGVGGSGGLRPYQDNQKTLTYLQWSKVVMPDSPTLCLLFEFFSSLSPPSVLWL